ncbi:MAG: hypothetical protein IAE90_07485 [Ignavibacteria bacterium]|nr:hypothetical protein [Ignavibacteria bacterium]
MLRKQGYAKDEIENMKAVELQKIQFALYKQNYMDWYGYQKFAPDSDAGDYEDEN